MTQKTAKYPLIFAGYGLLCLLAAAIMSINTSDAQSQWFPADGGRFGPITIEESNDVVEFELRQSLGLMKWNSVDVDVLDEQGNYLFGFGDEFWHEAGRDSDGRWEEAKDKYSLSVTFPEPGNYFLNITGQGNLRDGQATGIQVMAVQELGSSVAFLWLGIGSLVIAIFMFFRLADVD